MIIDPAPRSCELHAWCLDCQEGIDVYAPAPIVAMRAREFAAIHGVCDGIGFTAESSASPDTA